MDLNIKGKYAVISGGAKGIGEAITCKLLEEGCNVAILDKDKDALNQLKNRNSDLGKFILPIEVDLTEIENCQSAIKRVLEWSSGQLHILVNNAGVNDGVKIESGPDSFEKSLRLNLLHAYALVHYAVDALKGNQGAILNITSKVALTGQGGTSGYAASKGAINGLTREWAVDLAPHGVRVNSIAPAEVMTPLYEHWLSTLPNPEETLEHINKQIPLGNRMTTKEEIANLAVFLCSPLSSHTTGQIPHPDGGYAHLDRSCTSALNKTSK